MLELHVYTADLPFVKPISISRKVKSEQEAVFVELRYKDVSGWGEATVFPTYGASLEGILRALEIVRPKLSGMNLCHPFEFFDFCKSQVGAESFALCALDVAMHDLWAKVNGKSVSEVIGADRAVGGERRVRTSMSIMFANQTEMVGDLERARGFDQLKIKVGQPDDVEILSQLRKNSSAVFIADANGNLTLERALKIIPSFKELGVIALEQPLARTSWDDQKDLLRQSDVPLIADEAFARFEDLERCIDHFDGVCVKLLKSGGITPSLEIIRRLRKAGKRVHMGCMPESMIGIAALSQIGLLADHIDGDSVLFLKSLPGFGVVYETPTGSSSGKYLRALGEFGHGAVFEPSKGVQQW